MKSTESAEDRSDRFCTGQNRKPDTPSVSEICLYAILGTLMFAFKMMFASLPNIEPVTLMILVVGTVFGPSALPAVVVYIFLELLVWGIGFWSISYLYVWPLLFFISCLLRKNRSVFLAACLSALSGFSFGLLCAMPMLFTAGLSGAFVWWQAGALFDLIHGTANFILCLLFYKPLVCLLEKPKKKYAGTSRR